MIRFSGAAVALNDRVCVNGATKTFGHPVEGRVGVVDVGGGSSEVILGTVTGGAEQVHSFQIGSGMLAGRTGGRKGSGRGMTRAAGGQTTGAAEAAPPSCAPDSG